MRPTSSGGTFGLSVLEPALKHGVANDLNPALQIEFFQRIRLMGFHGFNTQVEKGGDFFITVALRNEPENFRLALAQVSRRIGAVTGVGSDGAAHELASDRGV